MCLVMLPLVIIFILSSSSSSSLLLLLLLVLLLLILSFITRPLAQLLHPTANYQRILYLFKDPLVIKTLIRLISLGSLNLIMEPRGINRISGSIL